MREQPQRRGDCLRGALRSAPSSTGGKLSPTSTSISLESRQNSGGAQVRTPPRPPRSKSPTLRDSPPWGQESDSKPGALQPRRRRTSNLRSQGRATAVGSFFQAYGTFSRPESPPAFEGQSPQTKTKTELHRGARAGREELRAAEQGGAALVRWASMTPGANRPPRHSLDKSQSPTRASPTLMDGDSCCLPETCSSYELRAGFSGSALHCVSESSHSSLGAAKSHAKVMETAMGKRAQVDCVPRTCFTEAVHEALAVLQLRDQATEALVAGTAFVPQTWTAERRPPRSPEAQHRPQPQRRAGAVTPRRSGSSSPIRMRRLEAFVDDTDSDGSAWGYPTGHRPTRQTIAEDGTRRNVRTAPLLSTRRQMAAGQHPAMFDGVVPDDGSYTLRGLDEALASLPSTSLFDLRPMTSPAALDRLGSDSWLQGPRVGGLQTVSEHLADGLPGVEISFRSFPTLSSGEPSLSHLQGELSLAQLRAERRRTDDGRGRRSTASPAGPSAETSAERMTWRERPSLTAPETGSSQSRLHDQSAPGSPDRQSSVASPPGREATLGAKSVLRRSKSRGRAPGGGASGSDRLLKGAASARRVASHQRLNRSLRSVESGRSAEDFGDDDEDTETPADKHRKAEMAAALVRRAYKRSAKDPQRLLNILRRMDSGRAGPQEEEAVASEPSSVSSESDRSVTGMSLATVRGRKSYVDILSDAPPTEGSSPPTPEGPTTAETDPKGTGGAAAAAGPAPQSTAAAEVAAALGVPLGPVSTHQQRSDSDLEELLKAQRREATVMELAVQREEILGPVLPMLVPEMDRPVEYRRELRAAEARWRELIIDRPQRHAVVLLEKSATDADTMSGTLPL